MAVKYDDDEDIPILYFAKNRPCMAYDLNEKMIARVDPEAGELAANEAYDFRADLKEKTPADLPKELADA